MRPFIFGSSQIMKDLERKVRSVAASDLPLLLEGESGIGKEALAGYIYSLSGQKGEFVCCYCRQADPEAMELELFGDGERHAGKYNRAAHGTLLLKHLALLPRPLQERLLAVMERDTSSGNSSSGETASVRIACTASEPWERLVSRGEFLPGLYFRLAVCRLSMPPLRQRAGDIPELFWAMVQQLSGAGRNSVPPPSPGLLAAMTRYSWPGNFRELENYARSYAVAGDSEEILVELQRRSEILTGNQTHLEAGLPLKEQVRRASRQLESEIIFKTLERHRWNRRRTARALRISYRTLLYKIKDCKLQSEMEAPPQ